MNAIAFYGLAALKKIRKLDLSVTYRCNAGCTTCNIWKLYRENPSLASAEYSLSQYDKFFSKYDFWNWISFTGGEPFLREDLNEIVEIAGRRCKGLYAVSIATSAITSRAIAESIRKLLEHTRCRVHINISLNGNREIHNLMKGSAVAFDAAVGLFEELRALRNRRLSVKYEYLIAVANQGMFAGFIAGNPSFSIDDFILCFEQPSFRYNINVARNGALNRDTLRQDIDYFLKNGKTKNMHDLQQRLFLYCVLNGIMIPCVAGKNTFYMDPYGNAFYCTVVKKNTDLNKITVGAVSCKGCYTPCESYFGLALGSRLELLKDIYKGRFSKGYPP